MPLLMIRDNYTIRDGAAGGDKKGPIVELEHPEMY